MNKAVGWILDAYIQGERAIVWLRTDEEGTLRLNDSYAPSFYILPTDCEGERELVQLLQDSPVKGVALEEKYTALGSEEKRRLLRITVDGTLNYRNLIARIEPLPQVKALYNTELLHIQQYLFSRLGVSPTSRVEIEYDDGKWIKSIGLIDDSEEIAPPPFSALLLDVHTDSSILSPNSRRDPIVCIETKHEEGECILRGEEQVLLEQFVSLVRTHDPDFLVCPNPRNTMDYLCDRAKHLKLDLQLGREKADIRMLDKPIPYLLRGRVVLDRGFFDEYGIAGLVERSRFSVVPPGIASRWTANRVIDSRNCYELLKRGYVIPKNVGHYEYVRTLREVVDRDRGGLILAPEIGVVHGNVAELDFESQYPNLIVREGLSYETVTPEGVAKREDALLPYVTKRILDRRLWFKRLRKKYDESSPEWLWCEQRQLALKMILVTLYGTSGCCWNRWGNVLCFEEINRGSRETMVETKNLVQQRGFDVIYADTDSIFVKKKDATREDYEKLSNEISQHIGLPIALDHHYKFLLLLPLESDPSGNMEAQKHYFGILTNGELLTRGIETRRHDCPKFIKDFQDNLIRILFDAERVEEVSEVGYGNALNYVLETIEKLMNQDVPIDKLIVSKILRKPLPEYTRLFPHVSAAVNLAQQGKAVRKGDTIDFVYVNATHHNPLRRVAPIEVYDSDYYDREKYRDMVLDAAETVLSTFGFNRQRFGLSPPTRTFHEALLLELKEEMRLEKETEEFVEK